ncbi:Hypothetical predicted protein [Lecanosticta acicola]|uniref:Carboxylesterase family protein n=1 Tax=Lecanosticta acicola TaxID=111012 RepID=A0AAI8YYN9_9PEZI|nr:Hypothetical predicted protein [Lecanosticta acicola]
MPFTRAKAVEVAEDLHIDEDAALDLNTVSEATPVPTGRNPLGEITGNSGGGDKICNDDNAGGENKRSGSKNSKGAKKDNRKQQHLGDQENICDNGGLAASTASTLSAQAPAEVTPNKNESSPASRAASDDLVKDTPELEMSLSPVHDIRSQSPSSTLRMTRSQLRKSPRVLEEVVPGVQVDEKLPNGEEETILKASLGGAVQVSETTDALAGAEAVSEAIVSTEAKEMPNTLQSSRNVSPRFTTPSKVESTNAIEQPSCMDTNDEPGETSIYDKLEAAAVEAAASPSGSNKGVQESGADPITALDALDDALEKVNAEIPQSKAKKEKAAPVVRTTKASQARISLAHGPKDAPRVPSWGKPRPSMSTSQSTLRRVTSVSSEKPVGESDEPVEKKEVVIPHSKPRPMSMNFPAPPPPPKSTKAPTKSTFQLPGEAVAAKLKAAKEARLAREAEEGKKKTFKARPAPAATKAPAVRQTSTSKARESLMGGKPPATSALAASHKRASSVAGSRPSMSIKSSVDKPSSSAFTSKAANRLSTVPAPAPNIHKRPSTVMASHTNRPRPSIAHTCPTTFSGRPLSTAAPASKPNGTSKGKEVFNRAAQAKSAAEKEKREKEEAAKKARAEAAERSRQMSREWAEKQKGKKMSAKP